MTAQRLKSPSRCASGAVWSSASSRAGRKSLFQETSKKGGLEELGRDKALGMAGLLREGDVLLIVWLGLYDSKL
jgi:hypothetical protein